MSVRVRPPAPNKYETVLSYFDCCNVLCYLDGTRRYKVSETIFVFGIKKESMKSFWDAYWEAFRWTFLIVMGTIAVGTLLCILYHILSYVFGEYTILVFVFGSLIFSVPAFWVGMSRAWGVPRE